ncbi:helix-turn-helix transcriptional regulator [Variovorax sp. OV329]|uniref:ArsR/SmtB family transcription factor n=1 Tax=Variovorax sp. OV329 TaxID=1882825 RepID=UPI000A781F46|nr:metalloregulator ArsR/SmtB family transcription factor [Variovorax sp. OV329]
MVKLKASDDEAAAELDRVFAALSDRTRRDVLRALGEGEQSVSELAQPHGMSLPGFMKHLRVLEEAGLIARAKEGRVVRCELSAQPLQEAAVWLSRYEKFWTERFDALGRYLYHQKELSAWPTKPPAPPASDPRSESSGTTTKSRPSRSGKPGPTRKR